MNGRGRSAFQIAAGLDEDGNYLDGTGEQEARFLAEASWHERKRYEQLKREWEQWRYRRSILPREKRSRKMMRVGGTYFEPTTLRERHCKLYKSGNPQYCKTMANRHPHRQIDALRRKPYPQEGK